MQPIINRRAFLITCSAVPLAGACARMSYVTARSEAGRIVVPKSAFVAQPFALVETASLEFPIYVHRHGEDDFSAVLTRCMHRGCTVEPTDGRLVCPCHGSEYTVAGAVLKGPTERALIRFPVTTDAEHLYILDAAAGTR